MARNETKSSPGVTRPSAQPQMFSTLVASKPPREGRSGVLAGLFSVVFHGALIAVLFWVTLNVGEAAEELNEEFTLFEMPEEAPPPPPPPPPPPMEEAPPPVDVADVPQGFQTLSPPTVILPDIPPPSTSTFDARDFSGVGVEGGRADGEAVTVEDISAAPRFTPMTVRPTIRNREEVGRALQRFYPPLLRDAGIGGTVVLWFFIDENGDVVRTQVQQSSGQESLDDAAMRVAELIDFTPAQNRDRSVPVWIQWPITFQAN